MATKKKKYPKGPPTREERREQQMADAFETMSRVMAQQQETLDWLKNKLEGQDTKEQSRTIDPQEEFANIAKPAPPGDPGVIYKSGSRGLRQVLKRSTKIHTGDDYQIIPPVVADFDNSTFRTSDPEIIAMLDAKIEFREKRGLPPRIVKIKDERIAAELAKPETDVKPQAAEKITVDTPIEEALIS